MSPPTREKPMRLTRALSLALLIHAQCALADDEPYKVSATVVRDGRFVMKVNLEMPPRQDFTVSSREERLRLELTSVSTSRDPIQTVVKLVDFSGSQPRVMHTARNTEAPSALRSMTYRICGSVVTFISPSPAEPPGCDALVKLRT
jgi:hypothetical protein